MFVGLTRTVCFVQAIATRIVAAIAPGEEFYPPPAYSAYRAMAEAEEEGEL